MDSKSMFGIGVGVRLRMGLSNPQRPKIICLAFTVAAKTQEYENHIVWN